MTTTTISSTPADWISAPAAATAPTTAAPTAATVPGKAARRTGRVMSGLACAFLGMDAVMKLAAVPAAVEGTAKLGYSPSVLVPLGIVQAVCLALYLVPRTAALGALLWVGYLGGAVATHVRLGNPLFTHMLFPIYVAVLLWGGLWLRSREVRAVFPLRARRA